MKKLFLLDGSGFLYRAYFWIPELTNDKWQNVNAVFGFVKMILNIMLQQPDYFCIAWDLPKPTIRHQQYKEYKANRPKTPDDFKIQMPMVKELIADLQIPSLWVEWYEADDVLATLAKQNETDGNYTTLFSSDKDLRQLITDKILIQDPMTYLKYDTTAFVQKYWFAPKQMLDYLSLLWDASDNIPWVLGVGEKTATTLIQKYWTLVNIYDNLNEIGWKVAEKLENSREKAFLSYGLITLMDVPDVPNIETFQVKLDLDNWKNLLLNKWNFQSVEKLISKLDDKYNQPQQVSLFG